jgi:hypothetical protein
MKWMVAVLYTLVSSVLFAAPLTEDQKDVTSFISKIYSLSAESFEYAEFNGKYLPAKRCELYRQFFTSNLIRKKTDSIGCETNYVRYPSLGSEDLAGPYALTPLPKPKISVPIINGDKAQVEAIVKRSKFVNVGSRSVYFLTKTQVGWRIENALTYAEWPANPDPNADCKCNLLANPTAWQKAYLVKYEGFPN